MRSPTESLADGMVDEDLRKRVALLDGDHHLGVLDVLDCRVTIAGDGDGVVGLRHLGQVLRHDLHHQVGDLERAGEGEVEAGGVDRRGVDELHRLGGVEAAVLAHHRLDLLGRQRQVGIDQRAAEREIASGDGDLALDLRAIDGIGRAAVGEDLAVGEDRQRVERRDVGDLVADAGGEARGHLDEGTDADQVAVALAGDGGDLDDLAVGDRLDDRLHLVGLAGRAGVLVEQRPELGAELAGRRGDGDVVFERDDQRATHQHDGGDAGEHGAHQPAHRYRPTVRPRLGAVDQQRRLVAERHATASISVATDLHAGGDVLSEVSGRFVSRTVTVEGCEVNRFGPVLPLRA
jgi:hypothetical protein